MCLDAGRDALSEQVDQLVHNIVHVAVAHQPLLLAWGMVAWASRPFASSNIRVIERERARAANEFALAL
jgi:hypothetical protein